MYCIYQLFFVILWGEMECGFYLDRMNSGLRGEVVGGGRESNGGLV